MPLDSDGVRERLKQLLERGRVDRDMNCDGPADEDNATAPVY